jgi:hypothetical protein
MITVGICKEIFWIASVLKMEINLTFHLEYELDVRVTPNAIMELKYNNELIWRELIDGDNSMFGVESVCSISRIISCIDNNTDWIQYKYIE